MNRNLPRLRLHRETIRLLNSDELGTINGASVRVCPDSGDHDPSDTNPAATHEEVCIGTPTDWCRVGPPIGG